VPERSPQVAMPIRSATMSTPRMVRRPTAGRAVWTAIVANPYSGAGPNRQIVADLDRALRQRGMARRILWDPTERTAVLRDPDWAGSCRCIVAAGGDGTVSDVVNETRDIPVAMMPIGNENLFARQFGYRCVEQVADAVVRGNARTIDLGRAGERLFAIMVSAGLDADVVRRVAKWRLSGADLRRVTRLSYARPIFDAVTRYGYPLVELDADGQTHRGAHALVFNIPQYAARLKFVNGAACDDGLLDYVVFEKPGLAAMARYMAALAAGGRHLNMADVHHGTARRLTLRSAGEAPAPVQIDGDPAGFTPADLTVQPQALRVIVPG
jgi:diacylglycerol kinase family enzyme